MLTIPTIGWVARDKNATSQSRNVPGHGGPPVKPGSDSAYVEYSGGKWTHPYDPTANREATSLQSFPRKGRAFSYPPDLRDGKVYQDEWVAYLTSQRAAGAPAPIYAMDNEPELWADSTHVDVHPARPGYDSMLSTFLDYAQAVKDADPAGLVAGPESWGVTGYMFSALDEGGDQFATAADRKAHGGLPWLAWFLEIGAGRRRKGRAPHARCADRPLLPQRRRVLRRQRPQRRRTSASQAPRALWDGLYVEPSWVARTEWANLALLRRLHNLIDQYYPGTALGLTEWNFGGEDDISGPSPPPMPSASSDARTWPTRPTGPRPRTAPPVGPSGSFATTTARAAPSAAGPSPSPWTPGRGCHRLRRLQRRRRPADGAADQ